MFCRRIISPSVLFDSVASVVLILLDAHSSNISLVLLDNERGRKAKRWKSIERPYPRAFSTLSWDARPMSYLPNQRM